MSLTRDDAAIFRSLGVNLVRLGVMFPGVHPVSPDVDHVYLDQIEAILDLLHEFGIAAILDCHQDLGSAYVCGEGFPDWLFPPNWDVISSPDGSAFPVPVAPDILRDDQGHPLHSACMEREFGLYYASDAVNELWECLWDDCAPDAARPDRSLLSALADYWEVVAGRLGAHPAVLGLELLNEPWPGNVYKHPKLALDPRSAEAHRLTPAFAYIMSRIEGALDDLGAAAMERRPFLFFEAAVNNYLPNAYPVGGPGTALRVPAARQAYSAHAYCMLQNPDNADPLSRPGCDAIDSAIFAVKAHDRSRMGLPTILTEFGAVGDDPLAMGEVRFISAAADQAYMSAVYWAAKSFGDFTSQLPGPQEGIFQQADTPILFEDKAVALSYPYPVKVAGSNPDFAALDDIFVLEYDFDPASAVSTRCTEVFISQTWQFAAFATHADGLGFDCSVELTGTAGLLRDAFSTTFVPDPTAWGSVGSSGTLKICPRDSPALPAGRVRVEVMQRK
eukprot:gnl/Ergobibamus_cyprinoides/466.p1 GENE.gnl/Ergobibamus_cyprinoides/466~~gnl/Ergobibamus_cyprinoides/466.p1  ORF type:complete len:566 (+),score=151.38 gnl/Ergobibamus_cyprinoides/466:190-1698(+)